MTEGAISEDDPRAEDVLVLLQAHLAFANANTPPENVHALDVDGLCHRSISFFSYRRHGELLGVGALKELEGGQAELKSMHTVERARGTGIGRAMVDHLIEVARRRGFRRVSLETGATDAFAPARALYAGAGFRPCEAFGDYSRSPHNVFMTLALDDSPPER